MTSIPSATAFTTVKMNLHWEEAGREYDIDAVGSFYMEKGYDERITFTFQPDLPIKYKYKDEKVKAYQPQQVRTIRLEKVDMNEIENALEALDVERDTPFSILKDDEGDEMWLQVKL